ncbi:MAG: alpha/beta hydrolase [Novosphingobium sp.]|jgi:dienelactone hydrolase
MRILALLVALLAFVATPASARPVSEVVSLDNGAGRTVPVTLVKPQGRLRGVLFFSHGALSNPAKYTALTERWAAAGYLVVAPLHGDSTDWTGPRPQQADQLPWRMADMALVRAQLPLLAKRAGVKLGTVPLFATGHSFGALIAILWDDPALRSVIAISPPGPLPGLPMPPEDKPLLVVTGTKDAFPMIAPKWQDHLTAYNQAKGPALAYVGTDADHYFGGIYGRPELPGPKAEAAFADLVPLTLAFLKAPRQAARFKPKAGTLEAKGF